MGVLACNRNECRNIMCDTYVEEINSYICNECQDEFITYLNSKGLNNKQMTSNEITEELIKFMMTKKDTYQKESISVSEFFRHRTRC